MAQSSSGAEASFQAIGTSTRAVIFFATPHSGSDLADSGELLRRIAGVFKVTNSSLLATLNAQRDDGQLEKLRDDFSKASVLGMMEIAGIEPQREQAACISSSYTTRSLGMPLPRTQISSITLTRLPRSFLLLRRISQASGRATSSLMMLITEQFADLGASTTQPIKISKAHCKHI